MEAFFCTLRTADYEMFLNYPWKGSEAGEIKKPPHICGIMPEVRHSLPAPFLNHFPDSDQKSPVCLTQHDVYS